VDVKKKMTTPPTFQVVDAYVGDFGARDAHVRQAGHALQRHDVIVLHSAAPSQIERVQLLETWKETSNEAQRVLLTEERMQYIPNKLKWYFD
jgi:hypothetical protein